ncbi:MAG: S8 family serine peptidase, partial [Casimicrobium sp.]
MMKTLCRLSAIVAAFFSAIAATHVSATDRVANEVLVKLRSSASLAVLQAPPYSLTNLGQFGSRPIYRMRVPVGSDVDAVATQLLAQASSHVLLAEPHYTHQTPEARKSKLWAIGEPTAYTAQWAPSAMRLPLAHTYSRGEGVKVAVLDTGVDTTHPALAGKLLPGFDFVDNDSDPSESAQANFGYGHGTHVAALVALVAPQAKIVPYRVLDTNGEGNAWVLAEAIFKALDPDGN